MKQQYNAPAVDLAAKILRLLSHADTSTLTLTELATAASASKATCLRVVSTLDRHNLVEYNAQSRQYSLGPELLVLGSHAEESLGFPEIVKPYLKRASDTTGMTAVFMREVENNRLTYLAKQESSASARINVTIGFRFSIDRASYGYWIKKFRQVDEDTDASNENRSPTEQSLIRPADSDDDERACTGSGYIISVEQFVKGICTISSPIVYHRNRLLGVIAILGMAGAVDHDELEKYGRYLSSEAEICSQQLGGHWGHIDTT